jgi:hypothetical protein
MRTSQRGTHWVRVAACGTTKPSVSWRDQGFLASLADLWRIVAQSYRLFVISRPSVQIRASAPVNSTAWRLISVVIAVLGSRLGSASWPRYPGDPVRRARSPSPSPSPSESAALRPTFPRRTRECRVGSERETVENLVFRNRGYDCKVAPRQPRVERLKWTRYLGPLGPGVKVEAAPF